MPPVLITLEGSLPYAAEWEAAMGDFSVHKNLTPDEIANLATTIAVTLSKGLDDRELFVMYQLFFSIGGSLGLIARQRNFLTTAVPKDLNNQDNGPRDSENLCHDK
jgi:hypothetical protein